MDSIKEGIQKATHRVEEALTGTKHDAQQTGDRVQEGAHKGAHATEQGVGEGVSEGAGGGGGGNTGSETMIS